MSNFEVIEGGREDPFLPRQGKLYSVDGQSNSNHASAVEPEQHLIEGIPDSIKTEKGRPKLRLVQYVLDGIDVLVSKDE